MFSDVVFVAFYEEMREGIREPFCTCVQGQWQHKVWRRVRESRSLLDERRMEHEVIAVEMAKRRRDSSLPCSGDKILCFFPCGVFADGE